MTGSEMNFLVADVSLKGVIGLLVMPNFEPIIRMVGTVDFPIRGEFTAFDLLTAEENFLVDKQGNPVELVELWGEAFSALLTLDDFSEPLTSLNITVTYPSMIGDNNLLILENALNNFTDAFALFPKSIRLSHAYATEQTTVVNILDLADDYVGIQKLFKKDMIWTVAEEKYLSLESAVDLSAKLAEIFKDFTIEPTDLNLFTRETFLKNPDFFAQIGNNSVDFFKTSQLTELIPSLFSLLSVEAQVQDFEWNESQEKEFISLIYGDEDKFELEELKNRLNANFTSSTSRGEEKNRIHFNSKIEDNSFNLAYDPKLNFNEEKKAYGNFLPQYPTTEPNGEEVVSTKNAYEPQLDTRNSSNLLNSSKDLTTKSSKGGEVLNNKARLKLFFRIGLAFSAILIILLIFLGYKIYENKTNLSNNYSRKTVNEISYLLPEDWQLDNKSVDYKNNVKELRYKAAKLPDTRIIMKFDKVPDNTDLSKLYASIYGQKDIASLGIADLKQGVIVGNVPVISYRQALNNTETLWYFTIIGSDRVGIGCEADNGSSGVGSIEKTCNKIMSSVRAVN